LSVSDENLSRNNAHYKTVDHNTKLYQRDRQDLNGKLDLNKFIAKDYMRIVNPNA
jgi:hypothetical protein